MPGTIKPSQKTELQKNASAVMERVRAVDEVMSEETHAVEEKKEKSKDVQLVNFNLPKDKYEEYKKMFGAAGFTFARGNRMVLDYVLREIKDGNIELTESGFRKTLSARVGR